MPTSLVDSVVFRDIFGTEPMRRVWSDGNRTLRYLDIEAALARAQASVGVIPAKAAAEITKQAKLDNIDFEKLRQETERIGYPVLGVVKQPNPWGPKMEKSYSEFDALRQRTCPPVY